MHVPNLDQYREIGRYCMLTNWLFDSTVPGALHHMRLIVEGALAGGIWIAAKMQSTMHPKLFSIALFFIVINLLLATS